MPRPAKPAALRAGHMTKAERTAREAAEAQYRGNSDRLEPPDYLTDRQKAIFAHIVTEAAPLLGNIDVYMVEHTAVAIDRLEAIEAEINQNPAALLDPVTLRTRQKYSQDFQRGAAALGMTPMARAKAAITPEPAEPKKKTLLEILAEDDDDE